MPALHQSGRPSAAPLNLPQKPPLRPRPLPAGPSAGFGPGASQANELAAALARVSELEGQCAELRDAAARKDQVLAKSR